MLREVRLSFGSVFHSVQNIAHLARNQGLQPGDRNLVIWANLVVVFGVGKSQREQALLLQVSLCEEEK